jgi:hypothetical protein
MPAVAHYGHVQVADRLYVARAQPETKVILPPRFDGDLLHHAGVAVGIAGLEVLETQRPLAAVFDLRVGERGFAGAVEVVPADGVVTLPLLKIAAG